MKPFTALTLPNGTLIPNRLAKAAMEEKMADNDHAPSDELIRLYQSWADGGVGLMITGNVMIDRRAMTGPGGVVLESEQFGPRFEQWSRTARSYGAQIWMQINHPGRQMPAAMGQETMAPSAVSMDLGNFSKQFSAPRAMTEADIADVKQRFVNQDGAGKLTFGYAVSRLLSHASSTSADAVDLQLGDGSFSTYLKSLKLGNMMKYEYVPAFQSALYAPKPLLTGHQQTGL
ncbi:NADH oxidase [Janthinobacterium sp. KBS0711]|nr:NADH oxidase [Janthinobacterium sp. KBS0711]TSD74631.1 hypothetical protein FFI39_015415 [Janthinobacterium sp. KBS0711]